MSEIFLFHGILLDWALMRNQLTNKHMTSYDHLPKIVDRSFVLVVDN